MAIQAGDEWIFWTVIAIYLIYLAIAGIQAKKKTETFEDFLVAGRKLGPVLLGLSFGVTYFSAVMIVGGAEFSYVWGMSSMWIAVIDVLVGVFGAYVVLGKRTARMSEELQTLTLSELLGKRYQSEKLRHFTAVITLVFEAIYLVSIFMGLSVLLKYAIPSVPHTISYTIAVILCASITIVYLNVGGSHGAISTDVVESIIMLAGVIGVCVAGLAAIGGVDGLIATLYETGGSVPTAFIADPPALFPVKYIGYILVTSFGVWGMPQMVTRFFTVKKKRSLRWGLVISVIWALIVSMLCWWNGVIGQALYYQYPPAITGYDGFGSSGGGFADIVPAMMNDLLPIALGALFVAAVAAASLTTGEKVILVASAAFVRDYWQPKTKADDRKAMRMTKIVNTIVVFLAAVMALFEVDAVLALCMFAWAALASTTLVPLLFGLFWKKGTKQAALWTGVIAFIVAIVWKMGVYGFTTPADPTNLKEIFPFPFFDWIYNSIIGQYPVGKNVPLGHIHEFIASQIAAFIAFPIISLLTQKHKDRIDPKFVDDLFVKIKQPSGADRADAAAGKMDTPPATAPPPELAGKTN